jgi:hypothetical protein
LLKKYDAHINTEWCNKSVFIKYLFKYVTKGPDCSKAYLQKIRNGEDTPLDEETDSRNEVNEYLDACYICSFDSVGEFSNLKFIDITHMLIECWFTFQMKITSPIVLKLI